MDQSCCCQAGLQSVRKNFRVIHEIIRDHTAPSMVFFGYSLFALLPYVSQNYNVPTANGTITVELVVYLTLSDNGNFPMSHMNLASYIGDGIIGISLVLNVIYLLLRGAKPPGKKPLPPKPDPDIERHRTVITLPEGGNVVLTLKRGKRKPLVKKQFVSLVTLPEEQQLLLSMGILTDAQFQAPPPPAQSAEQPAPCCVSCWGACCSDAVAAGCPKRCCTCCDPCCAACCASLRRAPSAFCSLLASLWAEVSFDCAMDWCPSVLVSCWLLLNGTLSVLYFLGINDAFRIHPVDQLDVTFAVGLKHSFLVLFTGLYVILFSYMLDKDAHPKAKAEEDEKQEIELLEQVVPVQMNWTCMTPRRRKRKRAEMEQVVPMQMN